MPNLQSDAFVFFGATGDLAFRQIFPALQAMIRRGRFDMPIIGVGRSAANPTRPVAHSSGIAGLLCHRFYGDDSVLPRAE